jgi:hypothetical protein
MARAGYMLAVIAGLNMGVVCGQTPQQSYSADAQFANGGAYVDSSMIAGDQYVPAGQVGMPGIQYSNSIAAGDGGQLYPYDRQDPWLHGHFQRVPAYGGFASFRPYNYRHVLSQTQLATGWGMPHGMPYSQQFWNKYRGAYLRGDLHSQPQQLPSAAGQTPLHRIPATNASFTGQMPPGQPQYHQPATSVAVPQQQPIHVYPQH